MSRITYIDENQDRGQMDLSKVHAGDKVLFAQDYVFEGGMVNADTEGQVEHNDGRQLVVTAIVQSEDKSSGPESFIVDPEAVMLMVSSEDNRISNNRIGKFDESLVEKALRQIISDPKGWYEEVKPRLSQLPEELAKVQRMFTGQMTMDDMKELITGLADLGMLGPVNKLAQSRKKKRPSMFWEIYNSEPITIPYDPNDDPFGEYEDEPWIINPGKHTIEFTTEEYGYPLALLDGDYITEHLLEEDTPFVEAMKKWLLSLGFSESETTQKEPPPSPIPEQSPVSESEPEQQSMSEEIADSRRQLIDEAARAQAATNYLVPITDPNDIRVNMTPEELRYYKQKILEFQMQMNRIGSIQKSGSAETHIQLMKCLAKAGGWICGGAVRDIVAGDEPNDIDLFIPRKHFNFWAKNLRKAGFQQIRNYFTKDNFLIEIVNTDKKSPRDIVADFDCDVCQWYMNEDGEAVPFKNSIIEATKNKVASFNGNDKFGTSLKRSVRLQRRGWTVKTYKQAQQDISYLREGETPIFINESEKDLISKIAKLFIEGVWWDPGDSVSGFEIIIDEMQSSGPYDLMRPFRIPHLKSYTGAAIDEYLNDWVLSEPLTDPGPLNDQEINTLQGIWQKFNAAMEQTVNTNRKEREESASFDKEANLKQKDAVVVKQEAPLAIPIRDVVSYSCPHCNEVIHEKFGSRWDEKSDAHVCVKCGGKFHYKTKEEREADLAAVDAFFNRGSGIRQTKITQGKIKDWVELQKSAAVNIDERIDILNKMIKEHGQYWQGIDLLKEYEKASQEWLSSKYTPEQLTQDPKRVPMPDLSKVLERKESKAIKQARLVQKKNENTGKTEWALVSKKDPKKVLKWFGGQKPSEEAVAKEEQRIQYFKHKGDVSISRMDELVTKLYDQNPFITKKSELIHAIRRQLINNDEMNSTELRQIFRVACNIDDKTWSQYIASLEKDAAILDTIKMLITRAMGAANVPQQLVGDLILDRQGVISVLKDYLIGSAKDDLSPMDFDDLSRAIRMIENSSDKTWPDNVRAIFTSGWEEKEEPLPKKETIPGLPIQEEMVPPRPSEEKKEPATEMREKLMQFLQKQKGKGTGASEAEAPVGVAPSGPSPGGAKEEALGSVRIRTPAGGSAKGTAPAEVGTEVYISSHRQPGRITNILSPEEVEVQLLKKKTYEPEPVAPKVMNVKDIEHSRRGKWSSKIATRQIIAMCNLNDYIAKRAQEEDVQADVYGLEDRVTLVNDFITKDGTTIPAGTQFILKGTDMHGATSPAEYEITLKELSEEDIANIEQGEVDPFRPIPASGDVITMSGAEFYENVEPVESAPERRIRMRGLDVEDVGLSWEEVEPTQFQKFIERVEQAPKEILFGEPVPVEVTPRDKPTFSPFHEWIPEIPPAKRPMSPIEELLFPKFEEEESKTTKIVGLSRVAARQIVAMCNLNDYIAKRAQEEGETPNIYGLEDHVELKTDYTMPSGIVIPAGTQFLMKGTDMYGATSPAEYTITLRQLTDEDIAAGVDPDDPMASIQATGPEITMSGSDFYEHVSPVETAPERRIRVRGPDIEERGEVPQYTPEEREEIRQKIAPDIGPSPIMPPGRPSPFVGPEEIGPEEFSELKEEPSGIEEIGPEEFTEFKEEPSVEERPKTPSEMLGMPPEFEEKTIPQKYWETKPGSEVGPDVGKPGIGESGTFVTRWPGMQQPGGVAQPQPIPASPKVPVTPQQEPSVSETMGQEDTQKRMSRSSQSFVSKIPIFRMTV